MRYGEVVQVYFEFDILFIIFYMVTSENKYIASKQQLLSLENLRYYLL